VSEPDQHAPRNLPLRRILTGAFVLPWRNRIAVMRAVGLPMLLVVGVFLGWHVADSTLPPWLEWGRYLVGVLPFAWLAVVIHRLVLAHGWNAQASGRFDWLRLTKFFGALLLVWLVYYVALVISMNVVLGVFYSRYVPVGGTPAQQPINWQLLNIVAAIPASWLLGRLSLVLPAVAMDENPNLALAWRLSRRNGLKLMVVVGILPWLLDALIGVLYRDGASTFEAASLGALTGIFAVIEVTALSLSYFELTRASAPPPTHPPA
jgi:hypothetical protein